MTACTHTHTHTRTHTHIHTQGIYEEVLHELYQRGETGGEEQEGEVERGEFEEGGGEVERMRGDMGAVEADIVAVLRTMHVNVSPC